MARSSRFVFPAARRRAAPYRRASAHGAPRPPAPRARATKTLQVYVSQLRKELGPERLLTRAPGYELRVAEDELDVDRFEKLAAEARERLAAGDAAGAVEGVRRALDLWRGPALVEFREPFAERAAARLEDLRLAAVEDWLLASLEAGEAAGIVPELEELVASHPLREQPRELLMLALYRAGRQADALELFRRTRELFVSELGIEPSGSAQGARAGDAAPGPGAPGTGSSAACGEHVHGRCPAPPTARALDGGRSRRARCRRNRRSTTRARPWEQQPDRHDCRLTGAIVRVQARKLHRAIARRTRAGHARDRRRLRLQPDIYHDALNSANWNRQLTWDRTSELSVNKSRRRDRDRQNTTARTRSLNLRSRSSVIS